MVQVQEDKREIMMDSQDLETTMFQADLEDQHMVLVQEAEQT